MNKPKIDELRRYHWRQLWKNDNLLRPLEVKLIKGMLRFNDSTEDKKKFQSQKEETARSLGYQFAIDIIRKGKWKSQVNNFSNYISPLIKHRLVEELWLNYKDNRGRSHKKKMYRLITDIWAFEVIVRALELSGEKIEKKLLEPYFNLVLQKKGKLSIMLQNKLWQSVNYMILKSDEKRIKKDLELVQLELKPFEEKLLKNKEEVSKK